MTAQNAPLGSTDPNRHLPAHAPLPIWRRCRCDQWGRCLADCPSADITPPAVGWLWNTRLGRWVDAR